VDTLAKCIAGPIRRTMALILTLLAVCCLCNSMPAYAANDAASLRDKYQSLTQQLAHNAFGRPLYLNSSQSSSRLQGDIYAVVNYPFATVNGALNDPVHGPANWCDVLILHLNTKYCHAATNGDGSILSVNLGKKVEEELSSTYRLQFNYRVVASSPGYFQVQLNADSGPMGTKDYNIVVEAVDIGENRTFLHLTYAYGFGIVGRAAMTTYLNTIGSDKVGFTPTADSTAAKPDYVGGVRGLVERNTMRYYLAIDAYLGSLSSPPDKRLEQRLTTWFNATEQYPQQLHEVDRQDYMKMKDDEYKRQQTAQ